MQQSTEALSSLSGPVNAPVMIMTSVATELSSFFNMKSEGGEDLCMS